MKFNIFLFLFLVIFFANLSMAQSGKPVSFSGGDICIDEEDWVQVLHDDFNGKVLDSLEWWTFFAAGTTTPNSVFTRAFDTVGTQQIYLEENIVLENGILNIVTKKETATWMGITKPYTSGTIYSKKKFRKYSKFEIKAKVPCEKGLVSAFWVFGWTTEIDIFEALNGNTDKIKMSVHEFPVDGSSRQTNTTDVPVDNFCGEYRTYAAEYSAFKVDFLVDGELVFTFPRYYSLAGIPISNCRVPPGIYLEHPNFPRFGDPLSAIAGMGVGNGGFFGDPDANIKFPVILEIDYISVYQLEPKAEDNMNISTLIRAAPNPTDGLFKLEKADNVTILNLSAIKIISILGKEILEIKYNGEDKIDIDISNEAAGFYFITFINAEGGVTSSIKLLKN